MSKDWSSFVDRISHCDLRLPVIQAWNYKYMPPSLAFHMGSEIKPDPYNYKAKPLLIATSLTQIPKYFHCTVTSLKSLNKAADYTMMLCSKGSSMSEPNLCSVYL